MKSRSAPNPDPVLGKYLAACGIASRRASVEIVKAGRVAINGKVCIEPGRRVSAQDVVTVDHQPISQEKPVWIILHKPAGYTCSSADAHAERLAVELVRQLTDQRVYSVGRLDRDSEGLILFTNEGELANRLLHPSCEVQKVYEVTATGTLEPNRLPELLAGIEHDGERLKAVAVEQLPAKRGYAALRVTVAEGKKREVRRMCAHLGLRVARLIRTHFGPLSLNGLNPGQSRFLSEKELTSLRQAPKK